MTQSSSLRTTSSSLVRAPRHAAWQTPDWQRLWLSTQKDTSDWRSLALVPAGGGPLRKIVMQIAVALSHTGMSHLGGSIHVADAQQVELNQLMQFKDELERSTRGPDRVLIALPPLHGSVTALPLAQLADACLLCVMQNVTTLSEMKHTTTMLGKARILGAAMFRAV